MSDDHPIEFLDSEAGHGLQVAIWGFAVHGHMIETAALVAEGHAELVADAWDRTADDIAHITVRYGGGPYRQVAAWTALPWVTEHLIRYGDYPGRLAS